MPNKKSTAEVVRALAQPVAESLGLRLWEVKFVKEGAAWYLRIDIDKDGTISIEDCERMSRALDPVLDREDPIEQSYCLEVSSPGLNRELSRPEHFALLAGQSVIVRLIRPLEGTRDFIGDLICLSDGTVSIRHSAGEKNFKMQDIAFVKLNDADYFGGAEQ